MVPMAIGAILIVVGILMGAVWNFSRAAGSRRAYSRPGSTSQRTGAIRHPFSFCHAGRSNLRSATSSTARVL